MRAMSCIGTSPMVALTGRPLPCRRSASTIARMVAIGRPPNAPGAGSFRSMKSAPPSAASSASSTLRTLTSSFISMALS